MIFCRFRDGDVPGSFHKLTEEYPVLTKLTYVYNMYIHYKVRYVSDYTTCSAQLHCVQLLYQLYPPIPTPTACPLVGRRTVSTTTYTTSTSNTTTTTRPSHPRRFHAMLLVFGTSVRPCFETISRHCSLIFLLVGANVPFHFATVVCTTMVKQYDGAVR